MFVTDESLGVNGRPGLVDEERALIIRHTFHTGYPDGGESLYKFELLVDEARIIFAGSKSEKLYKGENVTFESHISWVMRKPFIIAEVNLSLDEIKDIISEALEIWSNRHEDKIVKTFRIRFTEYEVHNYIPAENVSYWDSAWDRVVGWPKTCC